MGFITTTQAYGDQQSTGAREIQLEPGIVERLDPGETFNFVNPNRPNANVDPFFRLMLREIAAGTGPSYESLSKDYSQSNYSSSRLALIDDRDLWKVIQGWFIRNFRNPIHREWLQQAVLSKSIVTLPVDSYASNPEKFSTVRFKPRGWTWIDPTKEVEAYKEAIRCGFTTTGEVIALTGGGKDLEDVLGERRQELDDMKEQDLLFDTDPSIRPTKLAGEPASTINEPTGTQGEAGSGAGGSKTGVKYLKGVGK
jgi:lambda family phage portal protein